MAEPTPLPTDARVLGLKPWFPWPLSRWRWLTEPVPAERLAALRIGLAFILLLDVLLSFLPGAQVFFGKDSMGDPSLWEYRFANGQRWSLFHNVLRDSPVTSHGTIQLMLILWAVAAFFLLIGLFSRVSAFYCWAMSVSVETSATNITNAGDIIRMLTLFYLFLCPCGAAWSIEAWLRRRFHWAPVRSDAGDFQGLALMRQEPPSAQPFHVYPWPLRLLFVQMMMIYLFNGIYKAAGETWHQGTSLHNVLCDLTLARWSYASVPVPGWLTAWMSWTVLWWELLFAPVMLVPWWTLSDQWKKIPHVGPAHVLFRWTREIFLVFGALFHLGILISMEIGTFAPYALCLYLPLLPWERTRWGSARKEDPPRPQAPPQA